MASPRGAVRPAWSRHRAPGRTARKARPLFRLTLLSYQVAKARRTGGAAAKCSNQADLHLTFIDPIWPSDLPQRPSLTSLPLATDQKAGGSSPSERAQLNVCRAKTRSQSLTCRFVFAS